METTNVFNNNDFVCDNSSVAMSQNGKRRIALKISHEDRVKKIRDQPDSFATLMKVIAVTTKDTSVCKDNTQIQYTDETGDVIVLSDDEDLAAAYEWAETQPTPALKLVVSGKLPPRKKSFEEDVQKKITEPLAKLSLDAPEQPQEDSSSSDDEEPKATKGMTHGTIGVPQITETDPKKIRKHQKAIKKMIKKQMMQHSKTLVQSIMEEEAKKSLGETSTTFETAGSDQIETKVLADKDGEELKSAEAPLNQSVHMHVECDGCGVAPINGSRYKCTVCKNFDYCEKCEQNKGHPHAFLKINKPDQAPRAMFTVVNEDMPGVATVDGEAENTQVPPFFRGGPFGRGCHRGGKHGGPWGRHGPHGGPGHHGPHHGGPGHHGPHHGGPGHHGPHHGGPHGPREFDPEHFAKKMENWGQCMGEWGKKMAEQHKNGNVEGMDPELMKKKVGWFMRNMFGKGCGKNNSEESEGKEGGKFGGCGGWRKKNGGGPCFKGGRMNAPRAVPTKIPSVISACAGDQFEVEVSFKNETHWAYKEGFHLENVPANSTIDVEAIKVPVGQIEAKGCYTVKIPINIKPEVKSCVRTEVFDYTLAVGITNGNGKQVGTEAQIKIRVIEKLDEMTLYDRVMQLEAFTQSSNSGTAEPLDFDFAVCALKEADYDVNKAFELIQQKKLRESVQPEMVDNDGDNLYD